MSTTVRVNTAVYAATHVATNLLRSIRQLVRETGLDTTKLTVQWATIERGLATWLRSGHLRMVVLEVLDEESDQLVGRFDFAIDYGYYASGDGDLWLDSQAVSHAVRKAGYQTTDCDYRIVVDTAPGAAEVIGWSPTTLRSTSGFSRHSIGTTVGGGSLGASLSYYRKNR